MRKHIPLIIFAMILSHSCNVGKSTIFGDNNSSVVGNENLVFITPDNSKTYSTTEITHYYNYNLEIIGKLNENINTLEENEEMLKKQLLMGAVSPKKFKESLQIIEGKKNKNKKQLNRAEQVFEMWKDLRYSDMNEVDEDSLMISERTGNENLEEGTNARRPIEHQIYSAKKIKDISMSSENLFSGYINNSNFEEYFKSSCPTYMHGVISFTVEIHDGSFLSSASPFQVQILEIKDGQRYIVFSAQYELRRGANIFTIKKTLSENKHVSEVGFFFMDELNQDFPPFYGKQCDINI